MKNFYLLAVFACLACAVGLSAGYGLEAFFNAFPNGDKEALANLTMEDLQTSEPYVEPTPIFNACPAVPLPADTNNISTLHPGHIKVVMAIGDSITAAMSAKDTTILNLREYRGISFAIGGDAGVTTMPNLLKPYSPSGFPIVLSTGIGKRTDAGTGTNGAVSGAVNKDMLGQVQWLVQQLKANTKINIANDWKLLTIWIGSNNLCALCNNAAANNAADFETNIMAALEYLYANVPRVFVNLLAVLDVGKLITISSGSCASLHSFECACATKSATTRAALSAEVVEYEKRANKIAANFAARKNSQFAVVVQPFLAESEIVNRTYLSPADCFHPSAICHQALSIALWNSMITPAAQKKRGFSPEDQPLCASSSTLLRID